MNEGTFQEVEELKNQSVVFVGVDNTLAGLIYFEDQIREDARYVVESLAQQGINMYMLSGDKRSTAEYVASAVGIPKEKVRNIELPLCLTSSFYNNEPYYSKRGLEELHDICKYLLIKYK